MGLSVSRSDVKRKCRLSVTDYDSDIDALISETVPVIQYSIADRFILDTGNTGLQATLNLGALELISGEFLAQLLREDGATEQIQIGDFTIGDRPQRNRTVDLNDPYGLKNQGLTRIKPFLKSHLPNEAETSTTLNSAQAVFTDDTNAPW